MVFITKSTLTCLEASQLTHLPSPATAGFAWSLGQDPGRATISRYVYCWERRTRGTTRMLVKRSRVRKSNKSQFSTYRTVPLLCHSLSRLVNSKYLRATTATTGVWRSGTRFGARFGGRGEQCRTKSLVSFHSMVTEPGYIVYILSDYVSVRLGPKDIL